MILSRCCGTNACPSNTLKKTLYEKLKKKYDALDAEKHRRKEQHNRLCAFIATLQTQSDLPVEFDPDLWLAAIEKATVYAGHRVVFTFKGGMEITEEV